ncbi:hypothetical protein [Streptomyces sp. NPDC007205]|uniref:terpene synthase family protein n=1 Tax=Streptomyces sp. NPDC007205 TaxID=3154316 RepID=UPI0033E8A555
MADRSANQDVRRGIRHLPIMDVPYEPTCHPEVKKLERDAIDWVSTFAPNAAIPHLAKTRSGRIVARTVAPGAPAGLLRAYGRMLAWGFWFDDEFVDDLTADSPAHLSAVTSVMDILDKGYGTGAAGERMETAFCEVVDGLRAALPAGSFQRWCIEMRLWFASMALQNHMRASNAIPSIACYKTTRLYTVCSFACIVIIDASWGDHVGWDDYWAPDAAALRLRAANVAAWQNDVFSYFAERDHPGRFWNLPSLYTAHGLTVEEALQRTAADAADEIAGFDRHVASLPAPVPPAMSYHIRSLRNWMRGCHDWSLEASSRYVGWNG